MVKKFQKVSKTSLVKNQVFLGGGISTLGPKRYCTLGSFFSGVFHREEGYCVMRPLTAQEMMFRVPSGNAVKTDVSRDV